MSLLSRLAVQAARAYGALSSNPNAVSADYLVVAGGGGGGFDIGGGGGAGGMLTSTATLSTLNTYSITVGAGGNGSSSSSAKGSNGADSVISGTGLTTVTSVGGGGGGTNNTGLYTGSTGGSGGGSSSLSTTSASGTAGQGNAGGAGNNNLASGGGGGAGAAGAAGSGTSASGNGGNGLSSSISGSSVTYAGGGGGGGYSGSASVGTGGTGGGGAGVKTGTATSGTVNTGGGGGGGGSAGGAGGSGIVIISYTSTEPKFVGGTITTSGGKQIHTFTSSGTLSPITPITASYLVVAGGGGGSAADGGGGGAGGLLTSSTTLYSGATYVVTVGAGGSGNSNGSNSVLSGTGLTTITCIGGGKAGFFGNAGGSGGSGGGAYNAGSIGTGTAGQGNNGGTAASQAIGGGGGGAGGAGGNGTSSGSGNGGIGIQSSISGTATYYAGGGGGLGSSDNGNVEGIGGLGGGGNGGDNTTVVQSGTANTGGGSGGRNSISGGTASGGSGIVIISYAGSQQFNGGLVTTSGGNTIHTFTSSGALTPLTNNLNNSLRFRSSATAYLSRTFASTGTNNKIQTFSAWVKRGLLSSSANYRLMGGYNGSANFSTEINFVNDNLRVEFGGSVQYELKTTQVFRDPSAWYHIVVAIDTTQATSSNRVKMYVNGSQITAFAIANYPAQNDGSQLTSANANNKLGASWSNAEPFDGYMADINFIDGQALEPYYFGNNDANGVWKPIQYKGTYGTNGFYLTFADTSALTTSSNAGLGKDTSGNGNYWTTNNISITSGSTYDAMLDVPTNTSATVANYATLNPLSMNGGTATLSNANLTFTNSNAAHSRKASTIGVTSGKWYAEATLTTKGGDFPVAGIVSTTVDNGNTYIGADTSSYGYASSGQTYSNTAAANYGTSFTTGDIIGIIYDADNGKLYFSKNGTIQNSGDPSAGTGFAYSGISGQFLLGCSGLSGTVWNINFGQRPFAYTPPTGYVALNTYNLPTPTILQGNKYMDATTYTGNGSTQVLVNQGQFKPDFVWVKARSATYNHTLYDSIRGVNNYLISNLTNAAASSSDTLQAFNSNGFTVGTNQGLNENASTYVGWQWQAGQGSTSSNTSGSITSTTSVSTTAGFSIVSYTGTGANATVGHGLGVAPRMIICKNRASATDWAVYHASVGNTGALRLNLTAVTEIDSRYWNNTTPTSTVFSIGSSSTVNGSSNLQVAYCFAEIAGFSRFGSYVGNGAASGPFIYTGFRPKFVMIKNVDTIVAPDYGSWKIIDTSRDTFNGGNPKSLYANRSYQEGLRGNGSSDAYVEQCDLLSNGFKLGDVTSGSYDVETNQSGVTYIYMAFAEHPFKNSNAR